MKIFLFAFSTLVLYNQDCELLVDGDHVTKPCYTGSDIYMHSEGYYYEEGGQVPGRL